MFKQDTIMDKSHDPFVIIDLRILSLPLTTEAFRMYAELKRYANKEGKCFPSYTRLAKIYKGSYPEGHESTLKRKAIASVQELIDWGLLIKEKRDLDDGSPATNLYVLTPSNFWKDLSSKVSDVAHKKRSRKKGSSPSELGSSEGEPGGSSPSELGGVVPVENQGSSGREPGGSSPSELGSSGSSTLTRSRKLDPELTRSKELDPHSPISPQSSEATQEEGCVEPAVKVEPKPAQTKIEVKPTVVTSTVTPSDQKEVPVNSNSNALTHVGQTSGAAFKNGYHPSPARNKKTGEYPLKPNGSYLFPWETLNSGQWIFHPEFTVFVAKRIAKYPLYKTMMAGEFKTEVHLFINKARYDNERLEKIQAFWNSFLEGDTCQSEMTVEQMQEASKPLSRPAQRAQAERLRAQAERLSRSQQQ